MSENRFQTTDDKFMQEFGETLTPGTSVSKSMGQRLGILSIAVVLGFKTVFAIPAS